MPKVEFYKLNNNGSQKVIAKCYLQEDGTVVCEGNQIFIDNLRNRGIKNYESNVDEQLYFKDGLRFLEQLKFNFTSGYLNASDIQGLVN